MYTHYLYSTTKVMLTLNSILHDQVPALRQHRQRHQCNLLYHRQQSEVRPQQRKWLFSSQPQLGQLSFRWAKAQSYTYIHTMYLCSINTDYILWHTLQFWICITNIILFWKFFPPTRFHLINKKKSHIPSFSLNNFFSVDATLYRNSKRPKTAKLQNSFCVYRTRNTKLCY